MIPQSGDKGKYTIIYADGKVGARWYEFECLGRYEGKAIIRTKAGHIHLRGEGYKFELEK